MDKSPQTPAHILTTKAVKVIFFEDRAQVFRHATVTLPQGDHKLLFEGITKLADDTSLAVEVIQGDALVTTAKLRRTLQDEDLLRNEEPGLESAAALRERITSLNRQLNQLHERSQQISVQLARIDTIERELKDQLAKVPQAEACSAQAFGQAIRELHREREEVLKSQDQCILDLHNLQQTINQANQRLAEIQTTQQVMVSQLVVQLVVQSDAPITLKISYFTPCALWRPSYRMRLVEGEEAQTRVHVESFGVIWQTTGEHWDDIEAHFSTARPQRPGDPPKVEEDRLFTRPKTDQERREIHVSTHEEEISLSALSQGSANAAVAAMPGVDDGGEPRHFESLRPISPPSTGRPVYVPIGDTLLPATTTLVAYPEVSPIAHLRARITWHGDAPLLAGPCEIFRGQEAMGRTALKFVGQGEGFEISFGAESSVQIRRQKERKDDEQKLMSRKQRTVHTVRLHMKNLGSAEKQVRVVERVPVSQIKQVEVEHLKLPGTPDKYGHVEWEVALGPNYGEEQVIKFATVADSKVRLDF